MTFIILIVVLALALGFFYNKLVSLKNRVEEGWS